MKKRLTALFLTLLLCLGLFALPAQASSAAPATPAIVSSYTHALLGKSSSKKVWIATDHGKKYHASKNCWTLKNSKHLKKLKLSEAKKKGYKQPCKVCYK